MNMAKSVTFQVDETTAKALKQAASQEFCSVGAVIRRAVHAHLQEYVDSDACRESVQAQRE